MVRGRRFETIGVGADCIPENLSALGRRELSSNKRDTRFAENEEETTYGWMRGWMQDDFRQAELAKGELAELVAERDAMEVALNTLNTTIAAVQVKAKQIEEYEGALEAEDAPVMDVEIPANIEYDEKEHEDKSAGEKAELLLEALLERRKSLEARRVELPGLIAAKEEDAQNMDLMRREGWNMNVVAKRPKGAAKTSLSVLLQSNHVRHWVQNFVQFDVYYRTLKETKVRWMNQNMCNVWGGVSRHSKYM